MDWSSSNAITWYDQSSPTNELLIHICFIWKEIKFLIRQEFTFSSRFFNWSKNILNVLEELTVTEKLFLLIKCSFSMMLETYREHKIIISSPIWLLSCSECLFWYQWYDQCQWSMHTNTDRSCYLLFTNAVTTVALFRVYFPDVL